jgi:hypothetical protein
MFRYLAAAAFAISVAAWAAPASAEDPTHEKCTCDLVRENVLNNGASVRNATACWSTEDPDRQWCDITVQAIEGDGRQPMIINQFVEAQHDPAAIASYLMDQAMASVLNNAPSDDFEELKQAREALPGLIKQYDGLVNRCAEGFLRYRDKKEFAKDFSEGDFACHIGETTGWLRMSFQVGKIRFVYMVAPHA